MKKLSTFLMSAGVLLRGSAGRRSQLMLLPSLLFSVCGVNPAIAGKEVFTRTKPHVNRGGGGWRRCGDRCLRAGEASRRICNGHRRLKMPSMRSCSEIISPRSLTGTFAP